MAAELSDGKPTVLIIDDDPSHLKLYSWIIERAGWNARTVEVRSTSVEFPAFERVDLVLMDYRFNSSLTALEIAGSASRAYPGAPIALLSDVYSLPAEMKPVVTAFIRKGEPEELVKKVSALLGPRAA